MNAPYTPAPTDITSDDKLWAALDYIFSPIVPIIVLLMEDKKNRPWLRLHTFQSLIFVIALYIITTILSAVTFGIGACILFPIQLGVQIYFAYKAYQGATFSIPVVTDFVKNQKWA